MLFFWCIIILNIVLCNGQTTTAVLSSTQPLNSSLSAMNTTVTAVLGPAAPSMLTPNPATWLIFSVVAVVSAALVSVLHCFLGFSFVRKFKGETLKQAHDGHELLAVILIEISVALYLSSNLPNEPTLVPLLYWAAAAVTSLFFPHLSCCTPNSRIAEHFGAAMFGLASIALTLYRHLSIAQFSNSLLVPVTGGCVVGCSIAVAAFITVWMYVHSRHSDKIKDGAYVDTSDPIFSALITICCPLVWPFLIRFCKEAKNEDEYRTWARETPVSFIILSLYFAPLGSLLLSS